MTNEKRMLHPAEEKLRVIITTDGEIDDKCSMLRFLLYTNHFDVEGILSVNSKWQKDGHGELWIHEMIYKYAQVYKNLKQHDDNYPAPEHLHSVTWQGLVDRAPLYASSPPYRDTHGSDLIIKQLLNDDPRPLYISMWGGGTMVAHAMWKMKNEHSSDDYEKAVSKIRMYFIDYQEFGKGGGRWLRENMPEALNILDYQFVETWNYRPRKHQPYEHMMGTEWLSEHVKTNHGPLGEEYYFMHNGELYVSEGDTPSYLWLVNNGLRSHERPDYGGWGGRHKNAGANQWNDAADDGDTKKPLWRWTPATQNDWAARLDWCVKGWDGANHPPVVIVDGPLDRTVSPGESICLSAAQTYDPDGDELSFSWWQYYDADSVTTRINIENATYREARFVVPDKIGRDIHIILEVTDNGTPALTRYRRIIFSIR